MDHKIIIIERPNNNINNKELLELMFETLKVPSIASTNCAALSAVSHCRQNTLVLDIGGSQTSIYPIFLGCLIEKGRLNSYRQFCLRRRRSDKAVT